MSSNKDKPSGAIILLFLGMLWAFVSAIADYLEEIVTAIGIILILAMLFWVACLILKHKKIRKVRQSDVIAIPSQTLYGVPMQVEKHDYETEGKLKSRWMVMSLRPELDGNNLTFVKLSYELSKVKVIRSEPKQDANYQTTKQVSSLTKEIFFEIYPQLSEFREQDAELERLENLVSTSEMYHSKVHLYQRARNQIQRLIDQAENLKREYSKCIREILIGAEISQFDPNTMSDILERKLALHSKYEALKTEFQNRKDELKAYDELSADMF